MNWVASIRTFIRTTMDEMSKCTWPSKDELLQSTILVIVVFALSSLFIAGVDQVLFYAIQKLIKF